MVLPGLQVARFSTERCREVETALIDSGYLRGRPSELQLEYRDGGCWHVAMPDERFVVAISLRPTEDPRWVLRIEPAAPVRPRVVFRTPPSEAQISALVSACYDVALVLHATLRPLCRDLRWEAKSDAGQVVFSAVPVPPPQS
jgi:hypothetical protein